jgi:hypothetical protein
MRGVTTQSPTFASIQVSCTPLSPADRSPVPSDRIPNRVPRAYPSTMASTAAWSARRSDIATGRRAWVSWRNSCTAITYQSEASTELYSAAFPASGKKLGSIPSLTCSAHSSSISRASANRSYSSVVLARQSPRMAMNVSRPQSENHGYPAMIVLPAPRATM